PPEGPAPDPAPADAAGLAASGSQGILGQLAAMIDGTAAKGLPIDTKLSGVLALAEQYPDLKLSDNFRRFMDALVETEKALCDERMTYSEVVNSYTTKLKTFPGNLFAKIYGFELIPYFEADHDAQRFKPVDY
ncbi:MAG: LemA family protein, partial [Deltaproteobacteria bacterium]|nr:LemA family protein [Deltaproteobacteria bacterium]